jgi:2-polyprenyl-3-methyl-5-hydroxy-6-metoxy-1,4-benzoquinol methylase
MAEDRQWNDVVELMQGASPVRFGRYLGYQLARSPRRLLHAHSYYKFAAKMIGRGRRCLDVGCSEGLGTWLLAKECGEAVGIDLDEEAIAVANANWAEEEGVAFVHAPLQTWASPEHFGAVTCFDVIEHVPPDDADAFLALLASRLDDAGTLIVGTPNITSRPYASEVTNAGHINMYDGDRLREALSRHFRHVFVFAANDEVVHTGFLPMAHYLLALCCGRRDPDGS